MSHFTSRRWGLPTLVIILVLLGAALPASASPAKASESAPTTAHGVWKLTGSMHRPREYHTATRLADGRVLVAGGYNGEYLSSAELYDPTTGTWSATGSMNRPRGRPTATLLQDGRVLVAGGCCGSNGTLSSAEVYDPATGIWSITGSLHDARRYHTATRLPGGGVLVAGGCTNTVTFCSPPLSSAEVYFP